MDKAAYKEEVAKAFERAAPEYDQGTVDFFSPMGRRLVELVAPRPGERILDIGCGRGACLIPAARAVGPSGRAVGIDIAPAMVDHAWAEARQLGLEQVEVRQMDAEQPAFEPNSFDVVTGSFSVIFLPDAVGSLARYAPLLAPGGRLGFTSPVFTEDTFPFLPPFFTPLIPESVLRELPAEWHPRNLARRVNGWLGDDSRISAALTRIGFTGVKVVDEPVTMRTRSGRDWVAWSHTQGMRLLWERLDETRRRRLADDITAALDAQCDSDGIIALDMPVRYVLAETAR